MDTADNLRRNSYKKDSIQENILQVMNDALHKKEIELIEKFEVPKLPLIFIVGAQRSGTTVLMQLITQLFKVSYPNNFIARYWDVPYIGAMLYNNLKNNVEEDIFSLSSDLGYTKGLNGPHEFGYFWKKWFPWESWEMKQHEKIEYKYLQKHLAAWQSVHRLPLVFKNVINVDFNIEKIAELFPQAVFIHIKRDLIYNTQSTYLSRIKLFGEEEQWFGVKPSTYNSIKDLEIFEQIAHQINDTNIEIDEQLNSSRIKSINISYEDLVNDPVHEISKLKNILKFKENIQKTAVELISSNAKKVDSNKFLEIKRVVSKIKQ